MAREYFKMFHSYLKSIEPLNDAERGRLFTAMLTYSITGEVPPLKGKERILFPTMQANIDRGIEGYEAVAAVNRANGQRGGRPKKTEWVSEDSEKTEWVSEKPNGFLKTQDKDKEEDKEKDNDKDYDKDVGDARAARTPSRPERETVPVDAGGEGNRHKAPGKRGGKVSKGFVPPTVEEVAAYVAERGSRVDPQGFVDFYAAKGWMVGQTPMQDWRAACRNAEHWERWNRDSPSQTARVRDAPAEQPEGQAAEADQLLRLYKQVQAQGMAVPPIRAGGEGAPQRGGGIAPKAQRGAPSGAGNAP